MDTTPIAGISSMATRLLLAELAEAWLHEHPQGPRVAFESIGGVDAAKRVQAGETFDVVVLASDAIDKLVASGRAVGSSVADIVRSSTAIAVRAGASKPDIGSESALREAVLAARTVGHSTGPSGVALVRMFERWGIADPLKGRLVQAPAGTPVGALVARGEVELGFQQLSELISLEGIEVVGPMPPGTEIDTAFTAAVCTASLKPEAAAAVIDFLRSPATADTKRRHGMQPA